MGKKLETLAKHINGLFDESNPELVDASALTKKNANRLRKVIDKNYPRKYITGISIDTRNGRDIYTISVRRIYHGS